MSRVFAEHDAQFADLIQDSAKQMGAGIGVMSTIFADAADKGKPELSRLIYTRSRTTY